MAPKSCSSNEDQRFFQSRRLLLGVMGWGNHKMLVDSWGWSDRIGDLRGLKQTAVFCLDAFARFWGCRVENRVLGRQCHHNEKNSTEWEEILAVHIVYKVLIPNYTLNFCQSRNKRQTMQKLKKSHKEKNTQRQVKKNHNLKREQGLTRHG